MRQAGDEEFAKTKLINKERWKQKEEVRERRR